MNADEWAAWTDPKPMLRFLIGTGAPRVQDVEAFPDCRTSDRKLRLFACACYHRVSRVMPHPAARAAVETAERFADGAATASELQLAQAGIHELLDAMEGRWRASRGAERAALHPTHAALALALQTVWRDAPKAAYYASSNAYLDFAGVINPGEAASGLGYEKTRAAEARAQCDLLRDIFGNPFRPATFYPSWRTDTAVSLARQMYQRREFGAMPILADALQDAGCDNDDVLNHCRDAKQAHVRGCWVVDLVLDRK